MHDCSVKENLIIKSILINEKYVYQFIFYQNYYVHNITSKLTWNIGQIHKFQVSKNQLSVKHVKSVFWWLETKFWEKIEKIKKKKI